MRLRIISLIIFAFLFLVTAPHAFAATQDLMGCVENLDGSGINNITVELQNGSGTVLSTTKTYANPKGHPESKYSFIVCSYNGDGEYYFPNISGTNYKINVPPVPSWGGTFKWGSNCGGGTGTCNNMPNTGLHSLGSVTTRLANADTSWYMPGPTPTSAVACAASTPSITSTSGNVNPGLYNWTWSGVSGAKYSISVQDTITNTSVSNCTSTSWTTTSCSFTVQLGHAYRLTVSAIKDCGGGIAATSGQDSRNIYTGSATYTPTPTLTPTPRPLPACPSCGGNSYCFGRNNAVSYTDPTSARVANCSAFCTSGVWRYVGTLNGCPAGGSNQYCYVCPTVTPTPNPHGCIGNSQCPQGPPPPAWTCTVNKVP